MKDNLKITSVNPIKISHSENGDIKVSMTKTKDYSDEMIKRFKLIMIRKIGKNE